VGESAFVTSVLCRSIHPSIHPIMVVVVVVAAAAAAALMIIAPPTGALQIQQ
jgi:hypothetical protein